MTGTLTDGGRYAEADADVRARVALSRLCEPDDPALGELVESAGAEDVLAGIEAGTLRSRRLASYQARLPALDVTSDLLRAGRLGARPVTPSCAEWPAALDDLGPGRPLLLWVWGSGNLAELTGRAVAVVGARACSSYGQYVAGDLGAGLADRGWTVVSGAAYGIDAAAHRAALAAGGGAVAVLACGVDIVYPSAHHQLLSDVRNAGAVVSELPPGSRPTKSRFLGRNRVIAALARGTVVVEAAYRSGALNTAGHTVTLSRQLMAVPGPVTSATSAGCHTLMQTMDAKVVTDAADVIDLVGDLGVDAAPERRGEVRPHDGLDQVCLRVLDALPVRQHVGAASIARVAGVAPPLVVRALSVLSARGLAEKRDGRWRRAAAG